jgi:hypothetical protein
VRPLGRDGLIVSRHDAIGHEWILLSMSVREGPQALISALLDLFRWRSEQ